MQTLLQGSKCEQCDRSQWLETVKFWGWDDQMALKIQQSPDASYQIPKMSTPLRGPQLHAIVWMLQKDNGPACGGFLADRMGFGKTITVLGKIIVNLVTRQGMDAFPQISRTIRFRRSRRSKNTADRERRNRSFQMPALPKISSPMPMHEIVAGEREVRDTGYDSQVVARFAGLKKEENIKIKSRSSRPLSKKEVQELRQDAMIPFKPSAVYINEFHKQYTGSRGLPGRLAKMYTADWTPRIWAISGTPFADRPAGLRGYLSVMQTSTWADHPDFNLLIPSKIDSLQKDIDNAIATRNSEEIIRLGGLFEKQVLQPVMIRRNEESLWFGKPALNLPAKYVINVVTPYSNTFRKEIEALNRERLAALKKSLDAFNTRLKPGETARKLPTLSNFIEHSRPLRHIAVWPFVAIMLKEGMIKLTLEDFKKPRGAAEDWKNPYAENIQMLIKTSPRWRILVELIKDLPLDPKGKPKKILIYSDHPVTAGITYEAFKQQWPGSTAFFTSKATPKERKRLRE
ncbi:MAG: hypothetical protein Q9187_000874 [Circinaria calcarea]